jgi:hypothetical protein
MVASGTMVSNIESKIMHDAGFVMNTIDNIRVRIEKLYKVAIPSAFSDRMGMIEWYKTFRLVALDACFIPEIDVVVDRSCSVMASLSAGSVPKKSNPEEFRISYLYHLSDFLYKAINDLDRVGNSTDIEDYKWLLKSWNKSARGFKKNVKELLAESRFL